MHEELKLSVTCLAKNVADGENLYNNMFDSWVNLKYNQEYQTYLIAIQINFVNVNAIN